MPGLRLTRHTTNQTEPRKDLIGTNKITSQVYSLTILMFRSTRRGQSRLELSNPLLLCLRPKPISNPQIAAHRAHSSDSATNGEHKVQTKTGVRQETIRRCTLSCGRLSIRRVPTDISIKGSAGRR